MLICNTIFFLQFLTALEVAAPLTLTTHDLLGQIKSKFGIAKFSESIVLKVT